MKFIITFFTTALVVILLLTSLIIGIDPYDKLGNNLFNFETKAVAQSRENKFNQLEYAGNTYEVFVLGSSTAHRYHTKKIEELTGMKAFNYAVQHSTAIDYLAILKHIISKNKPKLILLQLGLTDIDQVYKVDNRLYSSSLYEFVKKSQKSLTSATPDPIFNIDYFTLKALADSLRVIQVNLFGKARHVYLEHGNYKNEKSLKGKVRVVNETQANSKVDLQRVELLNDFKRLCEQHNIKLISFSAPISLNHFQYIQKNRKKQYSEILSAYKSIFDGYIDLNNPDFLKKYDDQFYFRDSNHPSKEMSDIVLKTILK